MKRRIEELMNGIYEYKTPDLLFSCDEIRAVVKPGEKFFGSFTIKNKEQKRIRGFLYSSDARVACEPREFSGIEPKLSFDVDFTGIDIVIDSSGIKKNIEQIEKMAAASTVKRFIITNVDSKKAQNIIFGVNEKELEDVSKKIISSSICDVISLGPIYNLLAQKYDIESGFLVTLHPWLSYQNLLDGPAKSWSQPGDVYSHYALGRASTQNLIPKSTSAVRALSNVFPEAMDKIASFSYRIPTQIVSSAVLTLVLKENTTKEELLQLFEEEQKNQKYTIIETTDEPLISADYVKSEYSTILDTRWIQVKNGNHIELVYWYDNEWGYSSRIVDIVNYLTEMEAE